MSYEELIAANCNGRGIMSMLNDISLNNIPGTPITSSSTNIFTGNAGIQAMEDAINSVQQSQPGWHIIDHPNEPGSIAYSYTEHIVNFNTGGISDSGTVTTDNTSYTYKMYDYGEPGYIGDQYDRDEYADYKCWCDNRCLNPHIPETCKLYERWKESY